jgi:hypothetical protein
MARAIPARKSSPLPPAARKGANLLKVLGTIGQVTLLGLMAPDYRTVPDYRHLQLLCERQAVVTVSNEARRTLEEMAEEYRKMAEFLERKLHEEQRH